MNSSDTLDKLVASLAAAKKAFKPLKLDGFNPHFKNSFSTLQAINEATQEALTQNGLVINQGVHNTDAGVFINTRLLHSSGQWIDSGAAFFPVARADAQGYGSAITYGRRYQLAAFLALAADTDDDGQAASTSKVSAKERGRMAKKTTTTTGANEDGFF